MARNSRRSSSPDSLGSRSGWTTRPSSSMTRMTSSFIGPTDGEPYNRPTLGRQASPPRMIQRDDHANQSQGRRQLCRPRLHRRRNGDLPPRRQELPAGPRRRRRDGVLDRGAARRGRRPPARAARGPRPGDRGPAARKHQLPRPDLRAAAVGARHDRDRGAGPRARRRQRRRLALTAPRATCSCRSRKAAGACSCWRANRCTAA